MKLPTVAVRLNALLKQAGWRNEDLAVAAAMSAGSIAAIRRGRSRTVRPATARCIAAALSERLGRRVSPQYVAGDSSAES